MYNDHKQKGYWTLLELTGITLTLDVKLRFENNHGLILFLDSTIGERTQ